MIAKMKRNILYTAIVFVILCVVVVAIIVAIRPQPESISPTRNQTESTAKGLDVDPLAEDIGERMMAGDDVSEEVRYWYDRFRSEVIKHSQSGEPTDQAYVILAKMSSMLSAASKPYLSSASAYVTAGGSDARTFDNLKENENRIALLDRLISDTERFRSAYMAQCKMIEDAYRSAGFSEKEIQEEIDEWEREAALLDQLRVLQLTAYNKHRTILSLYKDHYARWGIDSNGYMLFQSEDANIQYAELLEAIAQIESEVASIQNKLDRQQSNQERYLETP